VPLESQEWRWRHAGGALREVSAWGTGEERDRTLEATKLSELIFYFPGVRQELRAEVAPTSALETPEEEYNVALAGGFNVVEAPSRGKFTPFQGGGASRPDHGINGRSTFRCGPGHAMDVSFPRFDFGENAGIASA